MTKANLSKHPPQDVALGLAEKMPVTDLPQITQILDAILMPLVGGTSLMFAKFSSGEAARRAERHFLTILVIITGITLRTVINCDEVWLTHTTTLGLIIVAALIIPSQAAVAA